MPIDLDFQLDRNSPEPYYSQVVETIRTMIASGAINPGQRLPTIRKLASQLEVSPLTVFEAYRVLRRLNLVESTVGRGTSVTKLIRGVEGIEFLRQAPRKQLDMLFEVIAAQSNVRSMATSVADTSYFPADEFIAGIDELRREQHWSFYYAPGDGAHVYLEAVASILTSSAAHCSADQLVATLGGRNGLRLLASEFVGSGSSVVIEGYQALGHQGLWSSTGVKSVIIPRIDRKSDFDTLEKVKDAKAIYVASGGCPATGRVMDMDDRLRLLRLASKKGWIVIDDASYALVRYGQQFPSLSSLDTNVMEVGTFTTNLAPGLRLGYLKLPSNARKQIIGRIHDEDAGGPLYAQLAFSKFVENGGYRSHMSRVLPKYQIRRDSLIQALKSSMGGLATWSIPMAGLSVGLHLEKRVNQEALFDACLTNGFAFCPGSYLCHPSESDRFIRLSFGNQRKESVRQAIMTFADLVRTI